MLTRPKSKLGMVVHICKIHTQETEADLPRILGLSESYSLF